MRKLLLCCLTLPLIGFSQEYARMMEDPNANFYDIQESFNNYYENQEYEKGKGFKQFKRWEDYTHPRVFPSGNMIPGKQIWKEYENFIRTFDADPSSRTANWQAVGPTDWTVANGGYSPGLGRVNAVEQHPSNTNIIYVGVPQGGVWKTTNGGTTWAPITDDLPISGVSDITIDPNNPNTLYVCTGDGDGNDSYGIGVLKSTDGGTTWSNTSLLWESGMDITARKLIISHANSNHLFVTTSKGVYKSVDAGANWHLVKSGIFKDVEMHPTDANRVYIANSKIFYSTDGGETFTQSSGISGASTRAEMAVTPAAANKVYAVCGESSGGFQGFYESTDNGQTFTLKTDTPNILNSSNDGSGTGGQAWYDLAIAADPNDGNRVYVGGVNIWRTTNAGNSFNIMTHWSLGTNWLEYVHADIHSLDFFGSRLYAGCDGGVWLTTNQANSWSDLSPGLQNSQFYEIDVMPSDVNFLVGGTQDNGSFIVVGEDGYHIRGGDGMNAQFHRSDADTWFYEWQYGGVHRTTDGGNSFDYIAPDGEGAWNTPFETSPTNHNTLYVGYQSLFKSTNLGNSYNEIVVPGGGDINEIAIYNGSDNNIAVSKSSQLLISTNNGGSWTTASGLPNLFITGIVYHPTDAQTMWVCVSGYNEGSKVYKTTNGGSNWTNISFNLPNVPANKIIYEPNSNNGLYVATDMGVFYKNDDLANWVSFSEGLPIVTVVDLAYHEGTNTLFAGTYGRGIYKTSAFTPSPNAPEANFEADRVKICAGQAVNFSDLSSNHEPGWNWTFENGSPSASSDQYPSVTWNSPGVYEVSLEVGNGNGLTTETKTAYIEVYDNSSNQLPFFEGFESIGTLDAGDYTTSTNNNNVNWMITSNAAATDQKSVFIDNSSSFPTSTYELVSPVLDLSQVVGEVRMSFKYAFAKKNENSNDRLQVYISNNCGDSWSLRKNINVSELSTAPDAIGDWTPTANQWVETEITNILDTYHVEDFKFRILFLSSGGNDVYIDDINLEDIIGIGEENLVDFEVYPNPFQDQIQIQGDVTQVLNYEMYTTDGKQISSGLISNGVIQTESIPKGMYILRLITAKGVQELKMVK